MIERRFLAAPAAASVATASARGAGPIGIVRGYAARFDVVSEDLGGWREKLLPGCFTGSLRSSRPVLALYSHVVEALLGSTASGTLSLAEDQVGLRFELSLPATSVGRDVLELALRGDLLGCSFGFVPDRSATRWERTAAGPAIAVVRKVKELREISIVAAPAYREAGITGVSARPETPQAARARAAVEKMRVAVAGATMLRPESITGHTMPVS